MYIVCHVRGSSSNYKINLKSRDNKRMRALEVLRTGDIFYLVNNGYCI